MHLIFFALHVDAKVDAVVADFISLYVSPYLYTFIRSHFAAIWNGIINPMRIIIRNLMRKIKIAFVWQIKCEEKKTGTIFELQFHYSCSNGK